jgi:hypothetical protein
LSDNINTVDNKVKKLEQTQSIVGLEVLVYDGKKWAITTFVDYTQTRNTVSSAGVRFTYKAGRSYTDRRIDELEAKLAHIEGFNQGKNEVPAGEIYTNGSTIGIRERF